MKCPTCSYEFDPANGLECPRCGESFSCASLSCGECGACPSVVSSVKTMYARLAEGVSNPETGSESEVASAKEAVESSSE